MYCLSVLDKYGLLREDSLSGNYLKVICPFHGEKTPSLNFNILRDSFHCFGCGKSGDILSFVCDIEGCDPIKAFQLLNKLDSIELKDFGDIKYGLYEREEDLKQQTINNIANAKEYFESIPKVNWEGYSGKDFRYNYLLSRGFKRETLSKFEIKVNVFSDYPIIIPVVQFGKFKGYMRRKVLESVDGPKYVHNKGLRKRYSLPGIRDWENSLPILICEGILDVITAYQYGYKNVAAILGCCPSDYQIDKIKRYNRSIICALDNDEAGEQGYSVLRDKLGKSRVKRFKNFKKDINELTEKQFISLIKNTL